jgi:DNA-binding FadR family transcriptional regulator
VRELLQVRQALEEGLMGMVVERIQPSDVDALAALASEMDARIARGESHLEADRAFHRRLFAPLGNAFLLRLIDLFWAAFHQLRATHPWERPDPHSMWQRHQAIVDALRDRDHQRATAAMAAHFAAMHERLDGCSGGGPGSSAFLPGPSALRT